MSGNFIYDIETYPNCFTLCAVYENGKGLRVFEISDRKNEVEEMLEFFRNVKKHGCGMVGFNNNGFDYPVIHYILEKARKVFVTDEKIKITAKEIYRVVEKMFEKSKDADNRFGNTIRDKDVILPQIDLFLIHHFDNKARSTSLKMLEFNMRSNNIEDLPFPVGMVLSNEQMDELIKYNKHDVLETLKFYNYSKDAIQLRKELSVEFGFDCTNLNDTKIGKELFINRLEQEREGVCYTYGKFGRTINQTKRDKIVIKDCLFDYIKFERPEFKAIHQWFSEQTITETKGVFSDLLEHQLGDVAKYAQMVVKRKKLGNKADCLKYGFDDFKGTRSKEYYPTDTQIEDLKKEQPMGWIEENELKSPKGAKSYYWCYNVSETLNVVIDGFRYDYGVGGIHGAKQGTIKSTPDKVIRTLDVASYYPNMAIANKIYPQHLGLTFCKVYKDLYDQRKASPKGSATNAALKLALNGVYG